MPEDNAPSTKYFRPASLDRTSSRRNAATVIALMSLLPLLAQLPEASPLLPGFLGLALAVTCATNVHAQTTESDTDPAKGKFEAEAPASPAKPYVVPDLLPECLTNLTQFKTDWFTSVN